LFVRKLMPNESDTSHYTGSPLRTARGIVAFSFFGLAMLVSDVLQRTVVAGAARLFPSARHRILTRWIQAMRYVALDLTTVLLGGARLMSPRYRIPAQPGVLVVMNHQSLLDIPLVVGSFADGYPRIVTRQRYARGIPLISHMVRLYQYPVVDPRATVKGHVLGLKQASHEGETPIAIFPEGSRTTDGDMTPWKRTGLRLLLGERRWNVYLLVADGMWRGRSVGGFVRRVSQMEIRTRLVGPFESPPPDGDVEAFIEEIRGRMQESLKELRKLPA
jgi:1-acyl-sn-glycerol-3-phosphate acyltransferase